MRLRMRYTLLGALLGLGAPIGSLIWRVLVLGHGNLIFNLQHEWLQARYFYDYMTFGTVVAFSLFGYTLGRENENLSDLSITDGLTGIFNHRYLHEQLEHEVQ